MRKLIVIAALGMSLALPAPVMAKTVILAIDVTPSTAFTTNAGFARIAGEWIAKELRDLPEGTTVRVETLGDYGLKANIKRASFVIAPRMSARRVARTVGGLVSNLPKLIAEGKLTEGRSTHIVGYLDLARYSLNCTEQDTRIILLSDGVESGEVDHRALMAGNAGLPKPEAGMLKGCHLTMAAIGQANGATPAMARHLIKEWAAYATAAGATFKPVPAF